MDIVWILVVLIVIIILIHFLFRVLVIAPYANGATTIKTLNFKTCATHSSISYLVYRCAGDTIHPKSSAYVTVVNPP